MYTCTGTEEHRHSEVVYDSTLIDCPVCAMTGRLRKERDEAGDAIETLTLNLEAAESARDDQREGERRKSERRRFGVMADDLGLRRRSRVEHRKEWANRRREDSGRAARKVTPPALDTQTPRSPERKRD